MNSVNKLKLHYVANSVIPSESANSIHVMKMCQAFAKAGADVTLVILDRPLEERYRDLDPFAYYGVEQVFEIKRIPVGINRGKMVRYIWRLHRLFRQSKPDLVYGRNEVGVLVGCVTGRRGVLEMHSVASARSVFVRFAARLLPWFSTYSGTVVISESLKQAVIQENPRYGRKPIIVAHDGADSYSAAAVKNVGDTKRVQVGYFGHLYPGKGMERIVEIAPRLPEVDFHIFGGTVSDIALWKEGPLSPNLYFHGHLPHAQLPALQAKMDILLAPYQKNVSVHGGGKEDVGKYMSPLKLFEYMAVGKAIICSDLPVLREILDESCALLVPSDVTDAWIAAIQSLLVPGLRDILGARAQERFLSRYTWDSRAKMLLETFTMDYPVKLENPQV
jgi:glycosyltransferase involved in cell wall biosynthesis